jgi:spore germination protein
LENKIGMYTLFTTIVVSIVGVSVFSYPAEMANIVGTDGWIIAIITGLIIFSLICLIYMVGKVNDFNSFYKILVINFGEVFSIILSIIFVIYNIFFIALGLRVFSEMIKMYLLQKTPIEFILITMILTSVYLIRGEINSLMKFNKTVFWLMFIPLFFILLLTIKNADFTNIFPILNEKPDKYMEATLLSSLSFGGFQIIYLLFPLLKNRDHIKKTALMSIGFVSVFYAIICILCLAAFSKDQTAKLLWPAITLIKSIDIPGTFAERWDGIVMTFLVMFYFTSFSNIFFLCSDIIKDAFNLNDIKISSLIIIPFIYTIAMYPSNISEVYSLSANVMPVLFIFSIIVLPIMLLISHNIRKKGSAKNEA